MRIYLLLFTETTGVWHFQLADTLRDMGHTVLQPERLGLNESWYRLGAGRWSFRHRRAMGQRLLEDVRLHRERGGRSAAR